MLTRFGVDRGVLLALLSYALYSSGDGLIRSLNNSVNVPTIAFFITLFTIFPTLLARPKNERWIDLWRMRHPVGVHIRVISGLLAGLCGIYAFTHLPMAQAYALIFLMPFFVTLFSVIILREHVGWRRWSALAIGFLGVLIVIRPGVQEITLAHFAALGVAFLGGVTITVLRKIASTERRTSIMGAIYFYGLLFHGSLMMTNFVMPSQSDMITLVIIGCLAGTANLAMILASTATEANKIAPTQYSQIIWGIVLGAVMFSEFPDLWTYIGLVIVAAAGLFTYVRELARGRMPKRFVFFRNRA